MKAINRLLEELQKAIETNNNIINNSKSEITNIQNKLYADKSLSEEIDLNKLLSLTDIEIKTILECLDVQKQDILYRTYSIYKPLVITYKNISSKLGEFEAPQYQDAVKWLNQLIKRIDCYFKEIENTTNDVNKIKEYNNVYNKYLNIFKEGKLLHPINNLNEFNNMLDQINLSPKDKGEIKKIVGIKNIELINFDNITKLENTSDKEDNDIFTEDLKSDSDKTNLQEQENDNAILEEKQVDNQNEEDLIIQEANEIILSEKEFMKSINEEEFKKYLASSISSKNKKEKKYQIVSIILGLNSEIEKYNNSKGLEKNRLLYLSNINEYIEVYYKLKK